MDWFCMKCGFPEHAHGKWSRRQCEKFNPPQTTDEKLDQLVGRLRRVESEVESLSHDDQGRGWDSEGHP